MMQNIAIGSDHAGFDLKALSSLLPLEASAKKADQKLDALNLTHFYSTLSILLFGMTVAIITFLFEGLIMTTYYVLKIVYL